MVNKEIFHPRGPIEGWKVSKVLLAGVRDLPEPKIRHEFKFDN